MPETSPPPPLPRVVNLEFNSSGTGLGSSPEGGAAAGTEGGAAGAGVLERVRAQAGADVGASRRLHLG